MVYGVSGTNGEGEAWKSTAEPEFEVRSQGHSPKRTEEAHEPDLVRRLQLAFAPIHKRAFGTAVGTATGLLVAAVTLFHVTLNPETGNPLRLLNEYFYGYSVSVTGVFVGGFWGFVVGFVGGWFAAFCRNLSIAISVFVTRTRAELSETRDFLDHI